MESFTPNEIQEQSSLWFMSYAGTYARLLNRTKSEAKRAFIVFCDLMLFQDYREVKGKNRQVFIDAFMASSIVSAITQKQLVEGSVEYQEILAAYLD